MQLPLDHPAWGGLAQRERARLAARIAADDARITEAVTYEARRSGHPPLIRFSGGAAAIAAAVEKAQGGAREDWLRRSRLIAVTSLAALALINAVHEDLGGVEVAAGLALALVVLVALGLWAMHRRTRTHVSGAGENAIVEAGRTATIIDAEAVHLYTVVPGQRDASAKRWPVETLGAVSYGWPGLPGLLLATSHRKTHLPLTEARDGSGERLLALDEADEILAGLFGERYAGTTLARVAA